MPIRADQLKEKEDYQKLILEHLRDDNGYRIRPADKFSPGLAMDTEMLLEFLESTQADTMDSLRTIYKDRTEETIINYINAEINKPSRGLIDVIKHGVEFDSGYELKLMYRKPDSTKNPVAVENYNRNIFSVMEEVYHKTDERIDLVLFLNGIAIFAVELKCNTSGQNYEDAIKQYKNERDCTTRLLKEKVGVFAAFAMDLNEVYFCTKLIGKDSFFNPFNMGYEFGKGNPYNDQSGINVSYMWEDIWTKDKILFLIERFIYIKTKERKNSDTGKVRRTKELIFPRFHQLRAVEKVMNDVILNHSSCNYLIEHSAGSGKTETISWLAHILSTVHDADNNNVFDTVLVITDRIVVDRQLQEAIMGMEHKSGQVKVMDDKCDSNDLAIALRGNTNIIVTTIHKFYYILDNKLLTNLKDKTFAVLIDEAHSSTEGTFMQSVTTVLTNEDTEEEKTEEDKMREEIKKSGKQPNVSMIAFTATPKPNTIQLFGTLNAEGKKESFDLYSMKQAIEEGYILNVLDNYVTWKTYCHINKAIEDDPELKTIAAKRKMARFIDLHTTNIAQKVEIIVEHFRANVAHFRYQSTHNLGSEFAFRCLTAGQHERNDQWSDIEKMEWQARTIAPKILMPRCTVKKLLSERLDNIQSENVQSAVLKAVVEEVAETYKVSRQSAAIRVSELGYPQAVELYDSEAVVIDRQHRKGSTAAKFHQQPIDEVSAFRLYMSNEFLKATLDTGAFCYAKGYFVLRDEKYVLPSEDALFLTEYARLHLSECTLDFSYKLVCSRTSVRDVQYMFRSDTEYKKLPSYDSNTQNMDEYNKALAKALDDADTEFQAQFRRNRLVNETTSQRMCKYMDAAHWNTSIFQSRTLLAPMDYTRVYQNHKFKVPSYTAMAVGLELTLHETEEALRLSGLGYDDSDNTDFAYMYILSAFHGCPIDECNAVLEKLNVKPLGTKSKK